MSLKAFHFVFIIFSVFISLGLGLWGVRSFQIYQQVMDLVLAGIGFVATAALLVYFKAVLRKYKNVSYL